MKVGLLTYYHSVNYGAVLQSYATAKVLSNLGHDVTFINFRQEEKKSPIGLAYFFRNKNFKRFMKRYYPKESDVINTTEDLEKVSLNFDCVIVGSDQTWNPKISKDKYYAFFLDFGSPNLLRVSYASSFGFSEWPNDLNFIKPQIHKALNNINHLTVRETSGRELLKNEFGLDATVVVDPTMLLNSYEDITGGIEPTHSLCCYILNRTNGQLNFARQLGACINKKPLFLNNIIPVKGFRYMYPPSIESWLKNIGGADLVITDSFHGCVFSLLYNRNFIVVTPKTKIMGRLYDLLKDLGLENRFFTDEIKALESKIWECKIDYEIINKKINTMRNSSIEFLKNALSQTNL